MTTKKLDPNFDDIDPIKPFPGKPKKRKVFLTLNEKRRALRDALTETDVKVAPLYNVSPTCFARWRKQGIKPLAAPRGATPKNRAANGHHKPEKIEPAEAMNSFRVVMKLYRDGIIPIETAEPILQGLAKEGPGQS